MLIYGTDDGDIGPQVSVLGPILWYVMNNGILGLKLPRGTRINEFADDIALVIKGKKINRLVRSCNTAVGVVNRWNGSKSMPITRRTYYL